MDALEGDKADRAFCTIGELAADLGIPQHILRYWETRFPHLRPLQRAGNRRYYRPADVALAHKIHNLLNEQGYTIKGVQKLLSLKGGNAAILPEPPRVIDPAPIAVMRPAEKKRPDQGFMVFDEDFRSQLRTVRNKLAKALGNDG